MYSQILGAPERSRRNGRGSFDPERFGFSKNSLAQSSFYFFPKSKFWTEAYRQVTNAATELFRMAMVGTMEEANPNF